MEQIILILLSILLVFVFIILIRPQTTSLDTELDDETIIREIHNTMQSLSKIITENQREIGDMQTEHFTEIHRTVALMQTTLDCRLNDIRHDNTEQLREIRETVEQKLKETLDSEISRSFRIVNDRLEQVYKGLGEMQLGSILQQILSPEQYDTNIATVPYSRNIVEFAVKLPDKSGHITYLPIDSKFPADTYSALLDAYDKGDKTAVESASKALRSRLLSEARDIHTKYVSPPTTTDYAIMFLPFEGLYAEAVNRGMVEELQITWKVMIAAPSTMAAMLNSIQMGFKTLAIERRSAESWELLGSLKNEFSKFEEHLQATQQRINQANDELDKLVGVRTRAIMRKLNNIESNG